MDNRRISKSVYRIIDIMFSAIAVFISGATMALFENSIVEIFIQNRIAQLVFLGLFILFVVIHIIKFWKSRDTKQLIDLVIPVVCIGFAIGSVINLQMVTSREQSIMKRVTGIVTIEYNDPGNFSIPSIEYSQGFLLDENHVLLSYDVMFSNKQVFIYSASEKTRLIPTSLIDYPYCIAYFEEKTACKPISFESIQGKFNQDGEITCYISSDASSRRRIDGRIIGETNDERGTIATDISSSKVNGAGSRNVVPVSRNGRLLGFLQEDKQFSENTNIKLLSGVFYTSTIANFITKKDDNPLFLLDYDFENKVQYYTATTYVSSYYTLPMITMENFRRSQILYAYSASDLSLRYIYQNQILLSQDYSIPLQGEALEYWAAEKNKNYIATSKDANDDGQTLIGFSGWIGSHQSYPLKLPEIKTDTFRRYFIHDKLNVKIICDQGIREVPVFYYDEVHRTARYE